MHSDPISDMATQMRNALMAGHKSVNVPYSKLKEAIIVLLKTEKFIKDYKIEKIDKFEEIKIIFDEDKEIRNIKKISKPGQRIYVKSSEMKSVKNGMGIAVVSTSNGIMPGYKAYKAGIGGEILLEIY